MGSLLPMLNNYKKRDNMKSIIAEGGCMCGAIRYHLTAEPDIITVCHCPDCRHASGAHCLAWIILPVEHYIITKGTPTVYKSCPPVERTFCSQCGTTLTYQCEALKHRIDVTIGSLDDPETFPPKQTCFGDHKLSWASPI